MLGPFCGHTDSSASLESGPSHTALKLPVDASASTRQGAGVGQGGVSQSDALLRPQCSAHSHPSMLFPQQGAAGASCANAANS